MNSTRHFTAWTPACVESSFVHELPAANEPSPAWYLPRAPGGTAGSVAFDPAETFASAIPVVAKDLVYAAPRHMLYLSDGSGRVVRYDLEQRALAGSWQLQGQPSSIDLSPDGHSWWWLR